ncbi:MAG: DUF6666 family protein [Pirellulaceae bacterium]
MIIEPRLLGGIFRSGLLFAAFLVWCLPTHGLGATPSNPLRRVGTQSTKAAPKVVERTETPKIKTVSNTEAEVAATGEVQFAANSVAERTRAPVRRTSSGSFPPIRQPMGYGPPPAVAFETKVIGPGVPELAVELGTVQGEVIYGDVYRGGTDGVVYGDGTAGGFGGAGYLDDYTIPCPVISLKNTEVFGGVYGSTGPRNRGQSASFGFEEGFNWGTPLPGTYGAIGAQFGLRATQSSLSGTEFTDTTRNQIFLTTGLFRRVDWGLQGGVVLDYLSEDWYSPIDMMQIRAEASWVFPCRHEFGFWFTANTNTQTKTSVFSGATPSAIETWQATDLYAFFYRRRYEWHPGAESRIFAGFTGDSDGLIGADARLPVGPNWALQTDFTYLVPSEGTGTSGGGYREEGWNVAISLVWYPGSQGFGESDYFRPLLNVAGNGTFLMDQR